MKASIVIALLGASGTVASAQPGVTSGSPPVTPAATQPSPVDPAVDPAVSATTKPPGEPLAKPPAGAPVFDAAAIDAIVDARLEARLALQPETAGWKDGFFIQSADGKSKIKIGGFTQFDGRFFVADADDQRTDQFGFRSIRPELAGTLFGHFDFRLLPDFAGGRVVMQDAYADIRYSEKVKLRFGKFKVPFGLERLQAETATFFVERGFPTQLAPNRDLGLQVFGELAKGAFAYQVGVFNGVADGGSGDGDASDDKEVAARVFVKPFVTGSKLARDFGIGVAGTYGDKSGTVLATDLPSFRTQGQSTFFTYRTGTTLMDTTVADGRHWRATAQAAWFAGPVGLLTEYVRSAQKVVLDGTHETLTADAWQVAGQWVLTGDDATFKSVSPRKPFDPSKGQWGAFDVTGRIGELRFAESDVFSQRYADPTKSARRAWSAGAGVDWFPNKNFRFVVDLERTWFRLGATAGDRPTETSIVGRVQTVF